MAYTQKPGDTARVFLKDHPVPFSAADKNNWKPKALVFTVKYLDLHPKNAPARGLWIAFDSKGNNTYGALIKDVHLAPIELRDIKDHANTDDDVTITHWNTAQQMADNNIAWIEAHASATDSSPRMPQLELRAPGLPQDLSLQAKLEVNYVRGNGAKPRLNTQEDRVELTADAVNGDTWRIWESYANEPFFGGEAVLTYKIMKGQTQLLAPQTIRFRIGGRNPAPPRCRTFIESLQNAGPNDNLWFLYAIAKSESADYNGPISRYNQFFERPPNSQARWSKPLWSDDDENDPLMPGGYGIVQVTLDTR